MKIWEVRFKKKSKKPDLVEAANHRCANDRTTYQFFDDAGNVVKSFPAITIEDVGLFSDPDDPQCYKV
ncbi:MAG: hypothetical protein ABSC89_01230 [Verrucomicrobiota bacterium]|jgi:hypothetical protein